jgi:hypothetical protein
VQPLHKLIVIQQYLGLGSDAHLEQYQDMTVRQVILAKQCIKIQAIFSEKVKSADMAKINLDKALKNSGHNFIPSVS